MSENQSYPLYSLHKTGQSKRKESIWAIEEGPAQDTHIPTTTTTPSLRCCKDEDDRKGVCCKEYSHDNGRFLLDPKVIRDVIIGLSDGLTVPFALTAGLAGAGSSRFVVLAGVAELVSGAISMGVGGYFSAQAERDHHLYQLNAVQERIEKSCSKGMVEDVNKVLQPYGAPNDLTALLADSLRKVRQPKEDIGHFGISLKSRPFTTRRKEKSIDENGLTLFLVEIGQGLEPITRARVYSSALTIGLSYMIGGLIPLLPYIIIKNNLHHALFVSIGITGALLLLFGVVKQRYSGAPTGWKGYTFGAISTLAVGGAAAAASYGIVNRIEQHSGSL